MASGKPGRKMRSDGGGFALPIAALMLLPCVRSATAQNSVTIDYLSLAPQHAAPSAALGLLATDTGLRGAQLALADTNTTGKFTGQSFTLRTTVGRDEGAVKQAFADALGHGQRLFVANLPADVLLALADMKAASGAIILDATSRDDRLRGADCRANMLHLLPSRAMLADALMQYLVVKKWTNIMLLTGRDAGDKLYADAIRHAAAKFQISIGADRPWIFNPAAQQADTGHYQVNDEVVRATQGVSYDVLVVADEADNFGDQLAYRTDQPRPIAGTQGLVPSAWSPIMDEYASTQLQLRFRALANRWMTDEDYGAWLAVRAIGEAATRGGSAEAGKMISYMRGADFALSGYKGPEFTFRAWDGQLRQPVLLADSHSVVSISPQPGFLHETNELDSLGPDQPETECHFHP